MANEKVESKLIRYIEDAHTMEENVARMLDSMIVSTDDSRIEKVLRDHRKVTERHADALKDRLKAHGKSPSVTKTAATLPGTLVKGVTDQLRGDKPLMNARDAYTTEHLEIAVYEVLERIASRAGDRTTVAVARRNRRDEEAMSKRIESLWDRFFELTLKAEGIAA